MVCESSHRKQGQPADILHALWLDAWGSHSSKGTCLMPLKFDRSRVLQRRAEKLIPGGVDSPVRAFRSVGGEPPFLVRGEGAYVWDADGNQYIDYVGSWGPLILGHTLPDVIDAITQAARR